MPQDEAWRAAASAKIREARDKNGRLGARKSRLGCTTCKARRPKCDERQPACERCTSNGLRCGGTSSKSRNAPHHPLGRRWPYSDLDQQAVRQRLKTWVYEWPCCLIYARAIGAHSITSYHGWLNDVMRSMATTQSLQQTCRI